MVVIWVSGVFSAICLGVNVAQTSWTLPAALAICLVSGLFALVQWRKSPIGELRWDGRQWFFVATKNGSSESLAFFDVTVGLDFQSSLLVRFSAQFGQRQWFWLQSKTDKAAWRNVRRAIFARPRKSPSPEPVSIDPGKFARE